MSSQAQTLRQTKNYHGGYNYYSSGKLVFQTRSGFGRQNLYSRGRKIGEMRKFGNTERFYFTMPVYSFKSGKITIVK